MTVSITFLRPDGTEVFVNANEGDSLMQAAVANDIHEIVAECGGQLACATCHCHIDQQWMDKVPVANDMEEAMLECVVSVSKTSRLSCQIEISAELDGLRVRLPESQYC